MISIHPTALVGTDRIGEGTRIWAFCNVLPGATIGSGCNICDRCFIENDVVIGDRVTIKCGVSVWDGIRLEDDVFVGPDVSFSNDARPRSGVHLSEYPKTIVRTGASIGTGSILVPGVVIGRWSMVGAGSLITRDVPDYALAYGSPARVHGSVCRCGKTLRFEQLRATCACGLAYGLGPEGRVRET